MFDLWPARSWLRFHRSVPDSVSLFYAETFARKPFHSHAALKTDSITHLYNINSFFPCVFISPDSEIIFRAKVSFFLYVFAAPESEIIFFAKVSVYVVGVVGVVGVGES